MEDMPEPQLMTTASSHSKYNYDDIIIKSITLICVSFPPSLYATLCCIYH